jgi:hypothetical protein
MITYFSNELMEQLDLLIDKIEESLVDLLTQSTTESKWLNQKCLQIDFEGFQEIVLLDGVLLFLDANGHQYDLSSYTNLVDIINVIKDNE